MEPNPPPPPSYEETLQQKVPDFSGSTFPNPPYPPNSPPYSAGASPYPPNPSPFPPNLPPFPPNPSFPTNGSYPVNPAATSEIPTSSIPVQVQPVNVTLVQATTPLFGPHPVATDCFYCHEHVVTSTEYTPGLLPWIIMLILFFLGFLLMIPWCLCCVPFCIDSFLDVIHRCPNCKRELARYRRI